MEKTIDFYAIIELMGHQKIAGKVTEQAIAGTNMLRIDVPAIGNQPAFTRYIGGSGIYAINPCSEDVLMAFLKNNMPTPVYVWDVSQMIREEKLRLQSGTEKVDMQVAEDNEEDEDDLPY